MVLRKPYGFLIKHFKLIHLIITGILVYLVRYNMSIYKYLVSCINDSVNRYNALEYINYSIFIWFFLVIFLFLIIYLLFRYKDKPKTTYIVSIVGYVVVAIYLFVVFSYMGGLPNNVIDQKTIRMYRDLCVIVMGFQYVIIIFMFIRGLGFDVKKFNFSKDIQELDLIESDGEEVEVNLNVDTKNIMRNLHKQKRELGYFYQEYKIIIWGILGFIIVIIGFNIYSYLSKVLKVYKQDEFVGYSNYVSVSDSYYSIKDEGNYIVVKFDVFKNGVKEKLDVNKFVLKINGEEYLPNKNICYMFNKLGNCYKKQYVNGDISSYILVYKIDIFNKDKTYLLYNESFDNSFKIKLNLENYE